jgi:antitoxin (DNA-binding transcriptional repressor) of toxin-antitoxin stability system
MERYDIGADDRLASMVASAERGEDVEIVREGRVVARVVNASDAAKLQLRAEVTALRASLPPEALKIDWSVDLDDEE